MSVAIAPEKTSTPSSAQDFTPGALQVLAGALSHAREWRHERVQAEDLLAALCRVVKAWQRPEEHQDLNLWGLRPLNLTLENIDTHLIRGESTSPREMDLSMSAKKVICTAREVALDDRRMDSCGILIGVLTLRPDSSNAPDIVYRVAPADKAHQLGAFAEQLKRQWREIKRSVHGMRERLGADGKFTPLQREALAMIERDFPQLERKSGHTWPFAG